MQSPRMLIRRRSSLALTLAGLLVVSGGSVAAATRIHETRTIAGKTTAGEIGPGPVRTLLRSGRYRLDLRVTPNGPTTLNELELSLSRDGKPVSGAHVSLTSTMLDMTMEGITSTLRETTSGRYRDLTAVLGMTGRWRLQLDITPPHASRFDISIVDRVA